MAFPFVKEAPANPAFFELVEEAARKAKRAPEFLNSVLDIFQADIIHFCEIRV